MFYTYIGVIGLHLSLLLCSPFLSFSLFFLLFSLSFLPSLPFLSLSLRHCADFWCGDRRHAAPLPTDLSVNDICICGDITDTESNQIKSNQIKSNQIPRGPLECQGGYQARPKIHVIRFVFQDQAMYTRTSFRGAKTCKIGKKGVFLVM